MTRTATASSARPRRRATIGATSPSWDDNNDGRLSRAELKPETPSAPDLELAYEELVGATEQEYVDDNMRRYNLRADRTIGLMSTRDFDEMVGEPDAAISTPRPELLP